MNRALGTRLGKLEGRQPTYEPGYWAVLRWSHPVDKCGHRQWGWALREKLGLHQSSLLTLVTNENARAEPEVIVAPQLISNMSDADLATFEASLRPGPWWLLSINGAYVFGDPIPDGLDAFLRRSEHEMEQDQ